MSLNENKAQKERGRVLDVEIEVFQRLTVLEVNQKQILAKVDEVHDVLTKAKGAKWLLIVLLGVYTFAITQVEYVFGFIKG